MKKKKVGSMRINVIVIYMIFFIFILYKIEFYYNLI